VGKLPDGTGRAASPLQLWRFLATPYEFFGVNHRRYGDVFRVWFPAVGDVVFVGSPALVKELFDRDREGELSIRDAGFLGPIFGERSVVVTVAEQHKQQRRMLTPPFHGAAMKACGIGIRDATVKAAEQWLQRGRINVHAAMVELTLDAALAVVLGPMAPERVEAFRSQLRRTIAACRPSLMFFQPLRVSVGPRSPWARFVAERAKFFALLSDEMRARRAAGERERTDLLSLLLGAPMPDDEIHEHILTMMVLGHESSAAALAWAIYVLDREPEVLRTVLDELGTVPDGVPTEPGKLPYLEAVCKEVLRMWPVVPEVRRRVLLQPSTVAGHELPAGIYLAGSIYLVHHHPSVYPDAEIFRPSRFLERKFAAHEFLPFGGGVRSCVGAAFSLYEMGIVLATLLPRVSMRVLAPGPVEPVRQNLSVAPRGGVDVEVRSPTRS
jgi:cytochrome P450